MRYERRFFAFHTAHSPQWYLRIWRLRMLWWPNERLFKKLEITWS